MPTVTATQVITDALGQLNVLQLGEPLSSLADGGTDALRRLNLMMGWLANQRFTIPAVTRYVCPLIAGLGASLTPYTIGLTGNLLTTAGVGIPKPVGQNNLVGAGLILTATTNTGTGPVEIPRAVMTDDQWEAIRVKDLVNVLFTAVYYRPDITVNAIADLGSLFLWPTPTDLTNQLVLYINQPLATFPDLTTQVAIPVGVDDLLQLNLAVRLSIPYGQRLGAEEMLELKTQARDSLKWFKTTNLPMSDLANDFANVGGFRRYGRFDIYSGEGG